MKTRAISPKTWHICPGQSYYGSAGDEKNGKYIEYIPGNLPIIFSSAHGGYLKPEAVKTRRYGSSATDIYTQEMTRQIMEYIYNETGGYPHVIINLLHRKKLDGNRDIGEAAQGDPLAKEMKRSVGFSWNLTKKYVHLKLKVNKIKEKLQDKTLVKL